MRIDVHAHYFPFEYLERLAKYGAHEVVDPLRRHRFGFYGSKEPEAMKARLAMMDRAKIDLQVLSLSYQLPYLADREHAVDAARFGNDLYAAIVREYPGRFAAFAATPLPHIEASIDEMHRALDELGMVGVTATTSVMGKSIADPMFDGFFQELNRRRAVLFLHPAGITSGLPLIDDSKLTWPIGAPLEDTTCLLQMMQARIPARFPDVRIILPHLGGFAPFLSTRLDELRAVYFPPEEPAPSELARHFYYDTVNGYPPALRCAHEAFGNGHILLGTDYPFWRDEGFQLEVDFVGKAGLPQDEVEQILGGTAEGMLGLKRAVAR